mmetsp:Transcript_13284/g.31475  ORF Transcript_13284/g.31475 Transcript_13284/m.31475 type:complete len:202 (-) Transcript_13284:127-732(-)
MDLQCLNQRIDTAGISNGRPVGETSGCQIPQSGCSVFLSSRAAAVIHHGPDDGVEGTLLDASLLILIGTDKILQGGASLLGHGTLPLESLHTHNDGMDPSCLGNAQSVRMMDRHGSQTDEELSGKPSIIDCALKPSDEMIDIRGVGIGDIFVVIFGPSSDLNYRRRGRIIGPILGDSTEQGIRKHRSYHCSRWLLLGCIGR